MKLEIFGKTTAKLGIGALLLASFTGCQSIGNYLNPFYETPPDYAYLGEKNDRALNTTYEKAETAREALEHMATYRRGHTPEPTYPVMQPAVVRLMWIPDHLNKNGDLVPAHYYYLKVLSERWAVQDSFELEQQLSNQNDASAIPYIVK
jgi:hypothetical protein